MPSFYLMLTLKFIAWSLKSPLYLGSVNKHLMTGPKGNSEFCFFETSMSPEAKPRGTLRFEGKQSVLLDLQTQNYKRTAKK